MSLSFQEKEKVVMFVSQVAGKSVASLLLDHSGITANEMNEFRKTAVSLRTQMRVVKNSLAQRALQNTPFSCFDATLLKGPTLMIFSEDDPGASARLVLSFMKEHPKLTVKAISVGGKCLAPADLKMVSELPTQRQAMAFLMSVLKGSIVQFVRTLKEPYAGFVRVLSSIGQSK
ncbi:MAG: 50S ribosomal protein L10 [Gammaproteobacteria bacterium]|nr:50S ribosomal protein L10 [Gammaproteobacteria bacterium]